jgi:hypothetical protein
MNLQGQAMREIGRVYAALDPAHRDEAPGFESNDALFESMPVDAEAWIAFELSGLCEDVRALRPGGIIGTYEEAWFEAPQLPALIALLERAGNAPPEARAFLAALVVFARRANARRVGITLVIGG